MKKIILILLSIIFLASVVIADAPCTFTWEPNTEEDLAGYMIYFSEAPGDYTFGGEQSPNFLAKIECPPGDADCCTYTKGNLSGPGYFFVATAYDTAGFESLPSNEVDNLPPGQVKKLDVKK